MRRAISVIFPLILTGCGLPPAVSIASYALDGVSLLSTGKSVGDHALSAVAKQDCALWRVVKNEFVCREYRNGERGVLVAFAETWENGVPGGNSEIIDAEDGPMEITWRDTRPVVQSAADPVLLPNTMSRLLPALDGIVRLQLGAQPTQVQNRINPPQQMIRRNHIFKIKLKEKAVLPTNWRPHLRSVLLKSNRKKESRRAGNLNRLLQQSQPED